MSNKKRISMLAMACAGSLVTACTALRPPPSTLKEPFEIEPFVNKLIISAVELDRRVISIDGTVVRYFPGNIDMCIPPDPGPSTFPPPPVPFGMWALSTIKTLRDRGEKLSFIAADNCMPERKNN